MPARSFTHPSPHGREDNTHAANNTRAFCKVVIVHIAAGVSPEAQTRQYMWRLEWHPGCNSARNLIREKYEPRFRLFANAGNARCVLNVE